MWVHIRVNCPCIILHIQHQNGFKTLGYSMIDSKSESTPKYRRWMVDGNCLPTVEDRNGHWIQIFAALRRAKLIDNRMTKTNSRVGVSA
jgi:hypothetical protein